MKEIKISEIEGIKVGNAEDKEGGTGLTVILFDELAPTGVDVRGGGPASRETPLLGPTADAAGVHAVLLSGGSAYGLDAAGGVMKYLEEHGVGFETGVRLVPLVCQSNLFDLVAGDKYAIPDGKMAYEACVNAEKFNYQDGCFGAGTGCTIGKFAGPDFAMKSGIGSYAVQVGDVKVGAIVAVNALGDVFEDGKQIGGILSADKKSLVNTEESFYATLDKPTDLFNGNTTIGIIITNGRFDKNQLAKVAAMAHNGYARAINPVHTTADGDSIYASSVGSVEADINMVGTLAARVMSEAIVRGFKAAESGYGFISYNELNGID